MAVLVRYFTDPACAWSWSGEPAVRRLMVEFGDSLSWSYVMGGLARDFAAGHEDGEAGIGGAWGVYPGLVTHWLDVSDEGGMPFDPRIWREAPIASTYPACMAVKAAAEQADDGGYRYLRALREGLVCFRRKLDTTESLVEEARRAKLDVERFRIDLASHAIVEAFGNDLEATRTVPEEARTAGKVKSIGGRKGGGEREEGEREGRERVPFPTLAFEGEDGERRWVFGRASYDDYRAAAEAAGASPSGAERPGVLDALGRFGRMATVEVQEVCGLPGPRAAAELWRMASEWQVKPVRVLTGHLWEPA